MKSNGTEARSLYTTEIIEFAALGVRLASLLEQGAEKPQFVQGLVELLPQIYLQMLRLPAYLYDPELDYIEEYITEDSYERVRTQAAELLGEDDAYLSAQRSEMQYSDTPLAAFISEDLADIYQHVGNLLGILRDENEEALLSAVGRCRYYFLDYWGAKLLEALTALHSIYTTQLANEDAGEDEDQDDNDTEAAIEADYL